MKDCAMQITLNLEEALFVQSAMKSVLKGMSKHDLEIFWPNADIANVLRQLDIIIDVLFAGEIVERREEINGCN